MSATPALVDPRGLRFSAALTSIVLVIVLVAPSPAREILLGLQALIFAQGAFGSLQYNPYSLVFRGFVRPRLGAPAELEDPRPPRFAQLVGFVFAVTALTLLILALATTTAGTESGLYTAGLVVAGFALVAALLNAVFGLCLGCEIYLLVRRLTHASPIQRIHSTNPEPLDV